MAHALITTTKKPEARVCLALFLLMDTAGMEMLAIILTNLVQHGINPALCVVTFLVADAGKALPVHILTCWMHVKQMA